MVVAKPQEDGLGCRHLSCKATSGLLIKKALRTCSLLACSLLAFVGGTLVEEALAVSGLLFFVSSLFVKAMALVLPHGVNCPLPFLVGAFRAGAIPM